MGNGLGAGNAEYKQAVKDMANTVVRVAEYYKGTLGAANYGVVGLMVGTGLMGGMPNGTFSANSVTTRAEVATILLRYEALQTKNPTEIKNLEKMREVGTKGTNAESMGYDYFSFNGATYTPTFGKDVWNKTHKLKNDAGTMILKHMLIVSPKDTTSVYYLLFFGEGNEMVKDVIGDGNLVVTWVSVTPNRDVFSTRTVADSAGMSVLDLGGRPLGTTAKYGYSVPVRLYDLPFTKGKITEYYSTKNIKSPAEMKTQSNHGVTFSVEGKTVTMAGKEG